MKRVLLVAPHFAPVNAPDGHRARMGLPYLAANGWQAEILCVRPEHRPDWRDDSLLATLPPGIPIHRCGAVPLSLSRPLGIGNLGWRALPHLALAGHRLLRQKHFDLVCFSTTQFITLLLGPLWQRLHRVPFVIDLQDPWLNDYYHHPGAPPPPGGWKYRPAHALAALLEPFCFRRSSGFALVSEDYLTLLARRYPWFSRKPCAVLPFGVPVRDFLACPNPAAPPPGAPRTCACIGALNPAFRTSLNVFFRAIARSAALHPAAAPTWRYVFTGTSYGSPDRTSPRPALESATRHGLAAQTSESTARIPYAESLRRMREADLLLVLGSDDPAYAPSRLHTVCAAGRPVLVVAARESVLARRARELPGVSLWEYDLASPDSTPSAAPAAGFLPDACAARPAPALPPECTAPQLAARWCRSWNQALTP